MENTNPNCVKNLAANEFIDFLNERKKANIAALTPCLRDAMRAAIKLSDAKLKLSPSKKFLIYGEVQETPLWKRMRAISRSQEIASRSVVLAA